MSAYAHASHKDFSLVLLDGELSLLAILADGFVDSAIGATADETHNLITFFYLDFAGVATACGSFRLRRIYTRRMGLDVAKKLVAPVICGDKQGSRGQLCKPEYAPVEENILIIFEM